MVAAGLLFFALFSVALGRPTARDELHVHERRSDVPSGFKYLGKADPNALLSLRLAVAQGDPAGLEAALYDVSTPGSKNYRQHLSKAEVSSITQLRESAADTEEQAQAFVTPKPDSTIAVKTWLSRNNVTTMATSAAGDWIILQIPVAKANAMLGTQFGKYAHEETNTTMIRTLAYSVPASVKEHIDVIHPATS